MLTTLSILFKLALSKIAAALAFMLQHWRVFVPLAIVSLGLWKINGLVNERDAARNELAAYEEQVRVATAQRLIENVKKETEFQTIMRVEIDYHRAELDKLRGLYNAEKTKSSQLATTNADLNKRLRNEVEAITAVRLSGGFNRPIGPAESGGNCDATDSGYGLEAYTSTIELACAKTTIDYNTLYQRCAAVNRIFGK